MCGRFTLTQPDHLEHLFGVEIERIPPPRYNIAPSQPVGVVVQRSGHRREFRLQRWGLLPSWAKDPAKLGGGLINARVETAHEKPSFRTAWRRRRCLIPADGFYEWLKVGKDKQPIYFQLEQQPVFAFGGLWETWQDIETCTVLTMAANPDMQPVHHRMPVIIPPEMYTHWLNPTFNHSAQVLALIEAAVTPGLTATPVSTKVNNTRVDDPGCIEAVDPQ